MAGSLEPNTHEVYGHYARAYVKPRLGHVRLQQLTATNLRRFYTELAASGGRRGQSLKPKTIKNVHALIHRALEDAVDQGLMTRNVAALRSARPPKLEKTERGVWTPENLRVFLTAMAADPPGGAVAAARHDGAPPQRGPRPALACARPGERTTDGRAAAGDGRGKANDPPRHQVPSRATLDRARPGDGGSAQGPPRLAASGAAWLW
jgi:hypothetical protein